MAFESWTSSLFDKKWRGNKETSAQKATESELSNSYLHVIWGQFVGQTSNTGEKWKELN